MLGAQDEDVEYKSLYTFQMDRVQLQLVIYITTISGYLQAFFVAYS